MAASHALIAFDFVGAIFVASIAPLYWKAGNWPVLLCCFWLGLSSLVGAVNVILWSDNVTIRATAWCEFASRVDFVSTFAVLSSTVLVLRRLESIAATRVVKATERSRRRQAAIEIGIGLGAPLLYLALAAVSQGHRFDITEGLGCMVYIFVTPVSIVLTNIPPLLVSAVALVYVVLCIRWLVIRHQQFKAVLHAAASGIDTSHYLRLFALTLTIFVLAIPMSWVATTNILAHTHRDGISKYTSWDDVHWGYGRIDQLTSEAINMSSESRTWYRITEVGRWSIPVACIFSFAFLGTSQECRKMYHGALRTTLKRLGFLKPVSFVRPHHPPTTYTMSTIDEKPEPSTLQSTKLFSSDIESFDSSRDDSTQGYAQELGKIDIVVHRTVHTDGV